jgi:hypothetical protein
MTKITITIAEHRLLRGLLHGLIASQESAGACDDPAGATVARNVLAKLRGSPPPTLTRRSNLSTWRTCLNAGGHQ